MLSSCFLVMSLCRSTSLLLLVVRSLSMHCYLCAPAVAPFSTTGVSVFIFVYLITRTSSDYFLPSILALLTSLSAWTEFLFTVLLSRTYSPSLFDTVLSVVPLHDPHAIIDLSFPSAETERHVIDRYTKNIYQYTSSEFTTTWE